MRISNPPRQLLTSSHPETECHGCTGGGSPLESDECTVHAAMSVSAHLDPPASCVYGMRSQLGWCMGVNPNTCLVRNGSVWNAWGTTGNNCGCACELLALFLALLRVTLLDTEFLRASSCVTRGKVSVGELYKRRPRLGNKISFVHL
jgi:hypothetical protein